MADELKDMEYSDIRAALTGKTVSASTETDPAAPPAAEQVEDTTVETPPPAAAEGEEGKAPAELAEPESRKEKRFSKLTKERDAERNARIALEARIATLEASATGKTATAAPVADGKPVKPDIDQFPTWNDYQKELTVYEEKITDWKVAQALSKKEQEAELARQKADFDRVQGSWTKQVEDLTEDNDDLDEAIKTVGDSVAKKGIIDVIRESEVGGKMVLYLHRNPDELKKVEGMSIASAARYLGKIEARIEGEVAAPAATKTVKALPKPPAQVGGAPAGAAKGFNYEKASDEDFKAQLVRDGIFRRR